MGAERLIANLLRIAQEDLAGAIVLAAADNRNAAYLLEQAAEKAILAVLTSEGIHGGIKHQLGDMVDKVPDANPLKPALRAIEELGMYATAYRYPTPPGRIIDAPSREETEAFFEKVRYVITEAASRFDVDLSKRDAPARNLSPIR
jgi:HEPN domain-containing protein